ncbi:SusC/RagA family TonB-linked outer membrane protein [Geofilum rubicundum]|uniref:TonB-dependent receptor n=1 Tax=Geofilum rubicundum JCM 15548 TaxID=1236989 RepID=A0A0E9M0C3_9BACT|nr:SusC/RagA family TonB-linked outer membrane protein [Geofilum rubicundum]GAO30831.1 TonB-dependent receptor [Geofilum rubicundum JCM 15548]
MKIKIGLVLLCCLLMPLSLWAQASGSDLIVRGTVTGDLTDETLIGVNVIEVDETKRIVSATVTDINGEFVIRIKNPENNLVFSFIGFVTKSVPIGDQRNIDVVMTEEQQQVDEVVVTATKMHSDGTFAIPQREVSTAVQSISTREFEGIQVTSVDDALQGRIAGLDIIGNSGDLGSGTSMRIRGITSINASSEPLIVVNGIPYEVEIDPTFDFASANQEQFANMLSINPDDIEDITVLKDAASTAIWGSKGANGVLVITTKKGFRGPTRVQYSYRLTRAVQPEGLKMLNGDDYTMLMKQAYFNPQQNENAANVREFMYDPNYSEYHNFNNNTNWFDAVTQTGFKHDHYVTVSGGGERARYRVSGGFLTQTGTVIGQVMDRFTTRAYLDYAVSDRIKFITEFSYTFSDNQRNAGNLLGIAYEKMPNVSIYHQDAQGNNTGVYYNISRTESQLHESQRDLRNPVALADLAIDNLKNYRILPTFRLQYDLVDPYESTLRYNMYVSFDVNNNKVSKFFPREVSNLPWDDAGVNKAESADSESVTVMMDNNITWQPKLSNSDHSFMMYGSYQMRTGNSSSQGLATTNHPSGYMTTPVGDTYIDGISSSRSSYRSNAFLYRAHYTYLSRYILGFTFRRDGSTKFGDDRKYGNFPGVSAKWIISDEDFMAGTSNWLSMLAIRPSYGVSGNQPTQEYLHFSRYSPYGSYAGMPATRPTTLQLSDLKWETSTSINYGLDLGFFDDRFVFDINFYNKRTEDLLFENLRLPSSSGFGGVPWQNVGTMDNNGWEFNFYTVNAFRANDFSVDFNFNLSNYVNTIVDLREDVLNNYNGDYNFENGTYMSRIQEGNSYGSIYGFRYKGVYQYDEYISGVQENAPVARDANGNVFTDELGDPMPMYFAFGRSNAYEFRGGDAIYEDINKDGSIDELDIVYLGNSNPKVNGGFGLSLRYKNFVVTPFFNFRYGNKIVNTARMNAENMYYNNNQSESVNWRWRKDGDVTDMPRALYRYGYNWLGSDRYVEDGSFLRMKHLTFNYSVAQETLKRYNLSQLSLYLTINNIFVLTNYTGVDPEVGYGSFSVSADNNRTPRSKDFTFGLTVSF